MCFDGGKHGLEEKLKMLVCKVFAEVDDNGVRKSENVVVISSDRNVAETKARTHFESHGCVVRKVIVSLPEEALE